MLQIGELARLAGVTPRAIRHYHHTGLLPEPTRSANGYRTYGVRALSRLVQIRRLSALGPGGRDGAFHPLRRTLRGGGKLLLHGSRQLPRLHRAHNPTRRSRYSSSRSSFAW